MINHTRIDFHDDRLKEIQEILDKLAPHEHADGMNECHICDQPLDEAILLELRKLLVASDSVKVTGQNQRAEQAPPSADLGEKMALELLQRWSAAYGNVSHHPACWKSNGLLHQSSRCVICDTIRFLIACGDAGGVFDATPQGTPRELSKEESAAPPSATTKDKSTQTDLP